MRVSRDIGRGDRGFSTDIVRHVDFLFCDGLVEDFMANNTINVTGADILWLANHFL
jgi:hypothetical protein